MEHAGRTGWVGGGREHATVGGVGYGRGGTVHAGGGVGHVGTGHDLRALISSRVRQWGAISSFCCYQTKGVFFRSRECGPDQSGRRHQHGDAAKCVLETVQTVRNVGDW